MVHLEAGVSTVRLTPGAGKAGSTATLFDTAILTTAKLTYPYAGDLTLQALEEGVGIVPGSLFFPDGRGTDQVRLSFSLVDEALIDDGIERLASAVKR